MVPVEVTPEVRKRIIKDYMRLGVSESVAIAQVDELVTVMENIGGTMHEKARAIDETPVYPSNTRDGFDTIRNFHTLSFKFETFESDLQPNYLDQRIQSVERLLNIESGPVDVVHRVQVVKVRTLRYRLEKS